MQRYLQIAFLVPCTLTGTLQGRRPLTRVLILTVTLGLTGTMIYFATRHIDQDLAYPTHNVKELFENSTDSSEKIILQTDYDMPDNRNATSVILKVRPFSHDMQIVHEVDTNQLDKGKWRRLF